MTPRVFETRVMIAADRSRRGAVADGCHTPRAFETRVMIAADRSRWGAVGGAAAAPPTL
jgi:hypothetical protein